MFSGCIWKRDRKPLFVIKRLDGSNLAENTPYLGMVHCHCKLDPRLNPLRISCHHTVEQGHRTFVSLIAFLFTRLRAGAPCIPFSPITVNWTSNWYYLFRLDYCLCRYKRFTLQRSCLILQTLMHPSSTKVKTSDFRLQNSYFRLSNFEHWISEFFLFSLLTKFSLAV